MIRRFNPKAETGEHTQVSDSEIYDQSDSTSKAAIIMSKHFMPRILLSRIPSASRCFLVQR